MNKIIKILEKDNHWPLKLHTNAKYFEAIWTINNLKTLSEFKNFI